MKYDFDKIIDRGNTYSLKWDIGGDILPLWVADMDFACAPAIQKALHERIDRQIYGYTNILQKDYTDAVCGWFKRRFDWEIDSEHIRYTAGCIQALSFFVTILSKPGDKIVIQRPVYYPFTLMVELQGREVSNNPLVMTENGYEMDFEDLEKKLADPEAVGMILCSPHNPVGRVWTVEELRRVVDIAKKYNKWIISDEIHCDLVRKGVKHIPLLKLAPDYADRIVACTSPSKTFNLAGMQLSDIIIPGEEFRALWKHQVTGIMHVNVANPLSICAMQAAYNESEEWLDQLNEYLDENIRFLSAYIAEKLPKAKVFDCQGTYLVWVDFRAYERDAQKLEERTQSKAKVYLDDGYMFGPEGEGFERFNVACPRSILKECVDRLAAEFER